MARPTPCTRATICWIPNHDPRVIVGVVHAVRSGHQSPFSDHSACTERFVEGHWSDGRCGIVANIPTTITAIVDAPRLWLFSVIADNKPLNIHLCSRRAV